MPEQTVNNVWGQVASSEFLTLPSGQTCYAKKVGMPEVLAAGLTSELDILTRFVEDERLKPQDRKLSKEEEEKRLQKMWSNPENMKAMIFLVDKIMPMVVTQPKVHCHYKVLDDGKSTQMLSPEERKKIDEESGVAYIYTDVISMEDKMFLFGWTTGHEVDLHSFRSGPSNNVADMDNVQAVQYPPQRSSRRRRR